MAKTLVRVITISILAFLAGWGIGDFTITRPSYGSANPPAISISNPPAANVDSQWITELSAAIGTGTEVQLGGGTQVAVEYEISTGTTAGVVVLEHSAVSGYSGTWAQLDKETVGTSFATAPSKQFFTYPGPLGYIRARVTTTFSGGGSPLVTVRIKRMFGQ